MQVRFGHADANREWASDRDSQVGRLRKSLDDATNCDWTVVDLKRDWKIVFPLKYQSDEK